MRRKGSGGGGKVWHGGVGFIVDIRGAVYKINPLGLIHPPSVPSKPCLKYSAEYVIYDNHQIQRWQSKQVLVKKKSEKKERKKLLSPPAESLE